MFLLSAFLGKQKSSFFNNLFVAFSAASADRQSLMKGALCIVCMCVFLSGTHTLPNNNGDVAAFFSLRPLFVCLLVHSLSLYRLVGRESLLYVQRVVYAHNAQSINMRWSFYPLVAHSKHELKLKLSYGPLTD